MRHNGVDKIYVVYPLKSIVNEDIAISYHRPGRMQGYDGDHVVY
jgi:hypothetical protein